MERDVICGSVTLKTFPELVKRISCESLVANRTQLVTQEPLQWSNGNASNRIGVARKQQQAVERGQEMI